VDEARTVIARLDRIELLERAGAPPEEVLAEIEQLLVETQAWLDRDAAPRQLCDLLESCRRQLTRRSPGSASLRPA
jgi:uncharacterized coiled-coil protein SlyX